MDRESIRAKTLEAYQQGPDAVVELGDKLVAELAVQVESLSARVASLKAENTTLRTQSAALEPENAALRARLGANSRNSGKPPMPVTR